MMNKRIARRLSRPIANGSNVSLHGPWTACRAAGADEGN
jgi:hypothetical protein